jgi:hypothetical protein
MIPLSTFLADTNNGHSDFQIDHFITTRSGGTLYGCYHQACREISSRVSAIVDCLCSIEETEIRIRISDEKAEDHINADRRALATIKARRLQFNLKQLEHRLEELRNEFIRFYAQCVTLYQALGFDADRPSPERLAQLEEDRWEHHIRSQIAMELFTQGRPGRNTVEALQSMPPAMRRRIAEECLSSEDAQRQCIAWYLDYSPNVPEPISLTNGQRQELLSCCESLLSRRPSGTLSQTAALPSPPQNTASDFKSAIPVRSAAG